jgi:hypothetical protein
MKGGTVEYKMWKRHIQGPIPARFEKKPSPLKPHGQIKRNFTGSIYGRFSIIYPHFIPIGQKHKDRRQTPCEVKYSHGLWPGELKNIHICTIRPIRFLM